MVTSRSPLLAGAHYPAISDLISIIDNISWVMSFCVALTVLGKNKRIKLLSETHGEN